MKRAGSLAVCALLTVGVFLPGCGDGARPMAPTTITTTDLEIPLNDSIRSALLSSGKTVILYAVRDKGGLKKKGTIGPFQGEANPTGSLNLSFQVAVGPEAVLSLQVNDAVTKDPMALGATYLSLLGGTRQTPALSASKVTYGGKKSVFIDLGSLLGSCASFYVSPWNYISFSIGQYYYMPGSYDDVYMNSFYEGNTWKGEYFTEPNALNHIAYLGNGDLVDYAYVPEASKFFADSRQAKNNSGASSPYLKVGDVYCIYQNYTGGHAWVQVTDYYNGDGTYYGLKYRTNSTYPFYAWEQSPCYNW